MVYLVILGPVSCVPFLGLDLDGRAADDTTYALEHFGREGLALTDVCSDQLECTGGPDREGGLWQHSNTTGQAWEDRPMMAAALGLAPRRMRVHTNAQGSVLVQLSNISCRCKVCIDTN